MSAAERDTEVLRTLAAMPFLDWLELAAVSGMAEVTAHRALGRLRRDGLVGHVRHASALIAPTRRWYATADGLCRVAQYEGTDLERLLRTHPVTAHWQRVLLGRLDAVAVVYRLAATVADAGDCFPRFRWYRSVPLDAAMALDAGRTLGVIRQGATADRTGFSDRIGRLLDPDLSRPRALMALLPDEARFAPDPAAPGALSRPRVPGHRARRGPFPGRRPHLAYPFRFHFTFGPRNPGPPPVWRWTDVGTAAFQGSVAPGIGDSRGA